MACWEFTDKWALILSMYLGVLELNKNWNGILDGTVSLGTGKFFGMPLNNNDIETLYRTCAW